MGRANGQQHAIAATARRTPSRPAPRPGELRPVLMSLQQRWTDAILTGAKTVELRRKPSGCVPGSPVILYASHPTKEVQGRCRVQEVISGSLDELWERTQGRNGCTRKEFNEYLAGCDVAYGIVVTDVERLPEPVKLLFNGPQSFRYLFMDEPAQAAVLDAVGYDAAPDAPSPWRSLQR